MVYFPRNYLTRPTVPTQFTRLFLVFTHNTVEITFYIVNNRTSSPTFQISRLECSVQSEKSGWRDRSGWVMSSTNIWSGLKPIYDVQLLSGRNCNSDKLIRAEVPDPTPTSPHPLTFGSCIVVVVHRFLNRSRARSCQLTPLGIFKLNLIPYAQCLKHIFTSTSRLIRYFRHKDR